MSLQHGSHVRFQWCLEAGLAMVLAGCGASSPSAGTAASVATPEATVAPSSAPGPVATSTAAEPFDLVWFSDSSAAIAQPMAQRIEERLGVEVRVHDFWGGGALGSAVFIGELIELQAIEDALKDAEMIVLYANPSRTEPFDEAGRWCYAPEAAPTEPMKTYTKADLAPFAEQLRAIYDRIFMLRAGKPVILRAVDAYVPILDGWDKAGVKEACTAMWEAWTGVAREIAAAYGVPMASMYDAFNGRGHDEDPVDKGWIGEDGVHPGDTGREAQVDVIDALGYEPVRR